MNKAHLLLASFSAIALVTAIAPHAHLQPAPPNPGAAPNPPAMPNPGAAPDPPAMPNPGAAPDPSAMPNPGAAPDPSAMPNPGAAPDPSAMPNPGAAPDPGAIAQEIAPLVIAKFQTANCADLTQLQPNTTPTGPQAAIQSQAIALLNENPELREQFLNQVAPVIANKLFDCGFIP